MRKSLSILLLCATVCMVSCDKDNPIPEPSQGEQANISVAMPADDSGIKLNWQAGDQLTVSRGGENQTFTLKSGEGTMSGTFNGVVPGSTGDYTITYGSGDITGQVQSADASTAHLKKHIRLETVTTSLVGKIDLKMTSSIMTFALSGLPADVGTLQQLTWAAESDTKMNLLPLDLTGCTVSNGTLTAYLAFAPTEMNIKKGGKLTATLTGSQKACKAVMTLADGVIYTTGKQYTTTVDGTNTPWQVMTPPMAFTVKVDATNGLDFNIPFQESGTTPAEIIVDWGDGSVPTVVASGTALTGNDDFNHIYAAAGTYQISITSSQTDDTKQQMPGFNFFNNRNSNNNSKKLISMNAPLLNTGETDFSSCFQNCTSLESIPAGLFNKNTQVTLFEACFYYCTALKSIPVGLFDKNTQVTSFEACFYDCTALKSIPVGLFDKNTQVTSFMDCFQDCASLTSIPTGLFDKNTQVEKFISCFTGCTSLESIPAGLFDKNKQVASFQSCFLRCASLTSIPTGLFDKNTQVEYFNGCFSGCTSLESIPTGLFEQNTQVHGFENCFYNCRSLTSIPTGLFNKNTQVADFRGCFYNCTSLTSIPVGLFDKNTQAVYFPSCFSGCTSLTSIPAGLFDKNTLAINFENCFRGCTSLTSIPVGLFDNNTQVTNFFCCFANCTDLASIPAGLFDKNTLAINFKGCFADCTALTLTSKIFSLNEDKATRFNGKEMNFEACFLNVGSTLADASSSIAPDLWNYTSGGATWATKDCYKGCKASNTAAADVPVVWGGSK